MTHDEKIKLSIDEVQKIYNEFLTRTNPDRAATLTLATIIDMNLADIYTIFSDISWTK